MQKCFLLTRIEIKACTYFKLFTCHFAFRFFIFKLMNIYPHPSPLLSRERGMRFFDRLRMSGDRARNDVDSIIWSPQPPSVPAGAPELVP